MHGTPIAKDKRFMLTAGTVVVVLVMSAFNRAPDAPILEFIGVLLLSFMGQSQWAQTKRATTLTVNRESD